MCCRAVFGWWGNLDVVLVDHMALLLELFDELAELVGEAVHGTLEAGQQVERHDDGEADAGDCGEEVLFHGDHLVTLLVGRVAGKRQPIRGGDDASADRA